MKKQTNNWKDVLKSRGLQEAVWEIQVPPTLAVVEDKKVPSRLIVFPIDYPDGTHGKVVLMKFTDKVWTPYNELEAIQIKFRV